MELIRKIYGTLAGHRRDLEVTKGTEEKKLYREKQLKRSCTFMRMEDVQKTQLNVVTCTEDWWSPNPQALMCFPDNAFKCVCVLRQEWKLGFVWFSSFLVAFKWRCWIQPSTRTTYPQSLMVLFFSITHPDTDLRSTTYILHFVDCESFQKPGYSFQSLVLPFQALECGPTLCMKGAFFSQALSITPAAFLWPLFSDMHGYKSIYVFLG